MAAKWQKVDTGEVEGATADHTAYEYQFGAEIDGVFVPAVTKSGGYVDALIAAGKQAKENATAKSGESSSTPSGDGEDA